MKETSLGTELPVQPDHRLNTINKVARAGTPARQFIKVRARDMQPGDRLRGTGQTVVGVGAGLRTPKGKVEVTLEWRDERRVVIWGAATTINIVR